MIKLRTSVGEGERGQGRVSISVHHRPRKLAPRFLFFFFRYAKKRPYKFCSVKHGQRPNNDGMIRQEHMLIPYACPSTLNRGKVSPE